jgi:hypothetical protein
VLTVHSSSEPEVCGLFFSDRYSTDGSQGTTCESGESGCKTAVAIPSHSLTFHWSFNVQRSAPKDLHHRVGLFSVVLLISGSFGEYAALVSESSFTAMYINSKTFIKLFLAVFTFFTVQSLHNL